MRKKVEEKKGTWRSTAEMVPVCEPGLFWEYRQYPQELLEKVDVFLVTFANELKALVGMDKPLEHSFEAICEKIGVKAHPSLSQKKM